MIRYAIAGFIALQILSFSASPLAQSKVVIMVNCDAGDDLREAIAQAFEGARSATRGYCDDESDDEFDDESDDECNDEGTAGPVTEVVAFVDGVCIGAIQVPPSVALTIIGEDPQTSVLRGEGWDRTFAVVQAAEDSRVFLRNLTIMNAFRGIRSLDSQVSLRNCVVKENHLGLLVEESLVGLVDSEIETEFSGGILVTGGRTDLYNTNVVASQDATYSSSGVAAQLGARVFVRGGAIQGHGTGVSARYGSDLFLDEVQMDNLNFEAFASEKSQIQSNRGTFDSGCYIAGDSLLQLFSSEVNGGITATTFGKVALFGATVNGTVFCDSSADAVCPYATGFDVIGCENCTPLTTRDAPSGATPTPPGVPSLEELVGPSWVDTMQSVPSRADRPGAAQEERSRYRGTARID